MTVRSYALVVCLVAPLVSLSACSSGSGKHASATTTNAAPTTTIVNPGGQVEQPFIAARPPVNTVVLRGGLLLLAPLAASDAPSITAATAFNRCAGIPGHIRPTTNRVRPPVVELTRATIKDWGQGHANGSVTPIVGHRLVWIIWYKSVALRAIGGPVKRTTGATGTPRAPSFGRADVMTFVDARTGSCLNTEGFPSSG